jgi:Transposase DDE domain.
MNSAPNAHLACLETFFATLKTISDPRDPRGVRHDYHGMVALVFLGLLARIPFIAQIERWAKKHWHSLRAPLGFKRMKPPVDTTISRNLALLSVEDFQKAFAEFLNVILAEKTDSLAASVDGKTAKQMPDENGDPLQMLNVFVHDLKIALASWSVHGDKTNEPGCLKLHLEKLFETYPALQILTGDAIYAQRPLLEMLQEQGRDYLFQVKENQGDTLDALKVCFADSDTTEPDDVDLSKKKEKSRSEVYGVTSTMPIIFANG